MSRFDGECGPLMSEAILSLVTKPLRYGNCQEGDTTLSESNLPRKENNMPAPDNVPLEQRPDFPKNYIKGEPEVRVMGGDLKVAGDTPSNPLDRTSTQFLATLAQVYNPARWNEGSGLAPQFQAQCQTVFPIGMLLQEAKSRGYKNSWEKRGMLFSVWPNLGRKVDRLENLFQDIEDGKTTLRDPGTLHIFLTTGLDLYNYMGMALQKVMREHPEAWDRLMKQIVKEIGDDAPDLVPLAKFVAGLDGLSLDTDARIPIGITADNKSVWVDNHGFAHVDGGAQ